MEGGKKKAIKESFCEVQVGDSDWKSSVYLPGELWGD